VWSPFLEGLKLWLHPLPHIDGLVQLHKCEGAKIVLHQALDMLYICIKIIMSCTTGSFSLNKYQFQATNDNYDIIFKALSEMDKNSKN